MKNKLFYIIVIFLLLQPLLDVSVNLISFPLSVLIRGLFMCFMIGYLLYNKKDFKINIILIVLMGISFLFNKYYLNYSYMDSLSCVIKLYYLFFVLIFFKNIDINEDINKYILYTLIIYIGLFYFSMLIGEKNNTYKPEEGKIGYLGLFGSINELSAVLIVLYYYVLNNYNKILNIILAVLLFGIAYLMGTKVLMLGLGLLILFRIFPYALNIFKKLDIKYKIGSIITIILIISLGGYLFTKTNTYNNMVVQAEFFGIDNIFSFNGINKVLFNDRLSFLGKSFDYYCNSDIINKFLGIGYLNSEIKLVEIDIFDVLFSYGIINFIVLLMIMIYTLFKNKLEKKDLFIFIFLILISLTSGHVFISPAVSIYFGFIVLNKKEKGEVNG